ncbi:odorant receptor 49a-like [Musca vetustissima]|uniref:odorant receptor 49a-like n=1 Tax=Musca vetustissima TaxID=27455 RepID=UPI002AB78FFF|nr:odorant receptor 49a-like [Musca vetustissima]
MAEVERYFEDFVNLPCVLLRTLGYDFLDLSRPRLTRWLMRLYFFLTLICCLYCTYFVADETLAEIVNGANNLPLLIRLINDFNYNAIGILKSFYFLRNIKAHKMLYKKFREIFPTSIEDRFAYRVNESYWPKWITTILYLYFCATALILFSPLVETILEYFVALVKVGYANAEFGYHKLYEEQSYVVDHRNPLGYVVIYSMEVMNSHYAIVFNICPDIWLVAYAIQLCMHFDYIIRNLEEYEPMEGRSAKDMKIMAELVRKHQILLE